MFVTSQLEKNMSTKMKQRIAKKYPINEKYQRIFRYRTNEKLKCRGESAGIACIDLEKRRGKDTEKTTKKLTQKQKYFLIHKEEKGKCTSNVIEENQRRD
ncbi:hypothetical protein OUZ56_020536 [Daphnia magna]|uniref:Uncharacterized protein n=1 Tax=Daphnia magna TaxID=35525 RepID=A0ABQ9ZF00_9CRUS|nr:hypothetical protein OUZ56_020536 [Daphnia magna]